MNLPTIIVLLVVLALVIVVIHFMRSGKGTCSCGSKSNGGKTVNSGKCASCSVDCPLRR